MKDLARLQEKKEVLERSIADLTKQKEKLLELIDELKSKESKIEAQVKAMQKLIDNHLEKATADEKDRLESLNQKLIKQMDLVNQRKTQLDEEISKNKELTAKLNQAIKKNNEASETTSKYHRDLASLKNKLLGVVTYIKENL